MDARLSLRAAYFAVVLFVTAGASYRTPNFVVETVDPSFAELMGKSAEKYRRELAKEWLDTTMPNWSKPCRMKVEEGPRLGAGGATTFIFDRGEVFGWQMTIQGTRERLLDSVLPHEVTHMIFASRFRQPVPRWADEGAATTCEHPAEKAKHRQMLLEFLRSNRGIAFNQMFAMTEYPRDVMPLYAQGFSLAEYLIERRGKRAFVAYLDEGMKTNQWSVATRRHYGVDDLGVLQRTWVAWVAQGSPRLQPTQPEHTAPQQALVSQAKPQRPEPNLIYHMSKPAAGHASPAPLVPVVRPIDGSTGQAVVPTSVALPLRNGVPEAIPAD